MPIEEDTIKHPKSSKNKYVVTYNQGQLGNSYLLKDGKVKYFDDLINAEKEARGRNCWSVAKITNPLGD